MNPSDASVRAKKSSAYPHGFFRKDCRLCHGLRLETFLDFGMQPHSDGFVAEDRMMASEPFFPLATQLCLDCGQVQIDYVVDPSYLYGDTYVYDPTITKTFQTHFKAMAKDIVDTYAIPAGSLAVDIGSNVGLLLSGFRDVGLTVQGVDPTPNMTAIAIASGIETITESFSSDVAKRIVDAKGRASVVTGTNVIAHIDDLEDLMKGVDILLDTKGVFVIEAPYLADLVEKVEYDTIYHQHLSYFSIAPLHKFFARFAMQIIDVQQTDSHGGSIRIFVARNGTYPVRPVVDEMIAQEKVSKLHMLQRLQQFAVDVHVQRSALINMLVSLKTGGATIFGVGAPAKGSTLLNFCGITSALVDCTTEKNTLKIGRYTPGTHLPIKTDELLLKEQPDYALILAWNFAPEIMKNLHAFKEKGGKFIIPIPSPHIV